MFHTERIRIARELLHAAKDILAMEFNTREEFEDYRKQHKMRPTTRVIIHQEERQKRAADPKCCDSPVFRPANAERFHSVMKKAKESQPPKDRWRVDVHDSEHYSKCRSYTTEAGSCVAVEPSGNIISVCKKLGTSDRGSDLLRFAVEHGGDRLDAFGPKLYDFYTKNGFEPVSATKFNPEYAPEGWEQGRDDPEDIVFYRYTGKPYTEKTYGEFLKSVSYMDYDDASRYRDERIEQEKRND